jgi:hypothetical protein
MLTKEKAVDRWKRSTAQNQTLSHESRWQRYSNQFVLRNQEPTPMERSLER